MKNNIAVQIGSGYGDLRKSEKQAADYILNHVEEAAELPKTGGAGHGRESDLMYGYMLDRKEGLDAVPLNITVTTERMLEETLKNLPLKTYRKAIDALRSAGIVIGSSEMGLTEEEYNALAPEEQKKRCSEVSDRFLAAGADKIFYTMDDLGEFLLG